jgi:hypothetical protein
LGIACGIQARGPKPNIPEALGFMLQPNRRSDLIHDPEANWEQVKKLREKVAAAKEYFSPSISELPKGQR